MQPSGAGRPVTRCSPESLAYITDIQIGLAYGQMRVGVMEVLRTYIWSDW